MNIGTRIRSRTTLLVLAVGLLLVSCTPMDTLAPSLPAVVSSSNLDQQGAVSSARLPEEIRFKRIASSDGLSHPQVLGITRDHLGLMWFATTNGLNRYDGYTYTIFRNDPGDRTTLDFDDLRVIYEDTDHNFWVGGAGGVDRFDRTTGTFSRLDEHGQVFCMLESQDGLLWVGFWHGLYAYDRTTGKMLQAFSSQYNPRLDPEKNLQGYVRAIDEDAQGNLWLGTDTGLYRLDHETRQLQRYAHDPDDPASLGEGPIHAILVDSQENVWVGTARSLDRLLKESATFQHYTFQPVDTENNGTNQVTAILEDESGNYWLGTLYGLVVFNPSAHQSNRFLYNANNPSSLSDNIVFNLFQDPTGQIWVGTRNGISIFNPRANQFKVIRNLLGLVDSPPVQTEDVFLKDFSEIGLEAVLEDQQGDLWLGTMREGLIRIRPVSGEIKAYRSQPEEPGNLYVSAIYQDVSGTLWAGTGNGWLERYDPAADELLPVANLPARIVSLGEDGSGNLWIGTSGQGVASLQIDRGILTRYPYDDPSQFDGTNVLSSHIVTTMISDHAGNPWIGTYLGGINRWIGNWITHYLHIPNDPYSLSHNYVMSFYEDTRQGQDFMWVGTMGGGLNRLDLDTKLFTHYQTRDGLADDIVSCILEDGQGMLWLSTPKGLTRFDPEVETFWNFNERDGVPGGSVLPGGCLKRIDNTLLFVTPGGLVAFDPAQVKVNQQVPPLAITSLMVNGQTVNQNITDDLALQLSYRENNLAFEFAALDYAFPDENTFAYRLGGVEENWVLAGTRHRVDYPDLNPGNYTFQVLGANSDGVWNERGLSVQISISPPFWMTGWFMGLAGLVVLLVIFFIYRMRMQRLELQRSELELQVKERTEEINQQRKDIEALYQADENLYRHLDLEQVLQALIDTAVHLLDADKSCVMCWDENQENLVIRAARNYQPQTIAHVRIPPDQEITWQVAHNGKTVVVEDTTLNPDVTPSIVQPEKIRAFIQVPIKIEQNVFGVFSADYISPRSFKEEEVRLLLALAQRAAMAIQNAQLYEKAQELAASQERSRLARDLHDAVTQTLFSASLIAEALPLLWERSPEKGRDRLLKLRQLNRGALAEMRTLLLELRPAALMETSLGDLVRQLGESITGRTGVPVQIHIDGDVQLPAEVHLSIYRIIQEALNNAAKHAQASQIEIELASTRQDDGRVAGLALTLSDDGIGFDPARTTPDQFGLKIMRERADSIGAELNLESQPGKGTRIRVDWRNAR